MELEMLKQEWSNLDARLSKIEEMNRKTVKELIANRTRTAVDKLLRNDIWQFLCCIFVPMLVVAGLRRGNVFTDVSYCAIVAMCMSGLPTTIYRMSQLFHYNITSATTDMYALVLRYRRAMAVESILFVPVCLIGSIVIGYSERAWMFADGRSTRVIVFFVVYLIVMAFAARMGFRRCNEILKEVENGIEELRA